VTAFDGLGLRNRRTVHWREVPRESPEAFRAAVVGAITAG